jgi:hypothetical protein
MEIQLIIAEGGEVLILTELLVFVTARRNLNLKEGVNN